MLSGALWAMSSVAYDSAMTRVGFDIRQLDPSSLALMHDMLTMFGDAFDEAETYNAHRPDERYLSELLGRDTFVALAALDDEIVIGGLAAYVLPKFEQARSEVYVYDLAVAEAWRRRGVATALIAALKPIAKARGASVIFVQADYGDSPAIALYESLGEREEVLHFDIAVD